MLTIRPDISKNSMQQEKINRFSTIKYIQFQWEIIKAFRIGEKFCNQHILYVQQWRRLFGLEWTFMMAIWWLPENLLWKKLLHKSLFWGLKFQLHENIFWPLAVNYVFFFFSLIFIWKNFYKEKFFSRGNFFKSFFFLMGIFFKCHFYRLFFFLV